MNATAFNAALAALDRDIACHDAALQVLLRATASAPERVYDASLCHHRSCVAAIRQEQRTLAEHFHWHKWTE